MADHNIAEQFQGLRMESLVGDLDLESYKGKITLAPIPSLTVQETDIGHNMEVQPAALPRQLGNQSDGSDSAGKPEQPE